MGTRADFYVGTGSQAEWLGSLAMDGYRIDEMEEGGKTPDYKACWEIKTAKTEVDYRTAVAALLAINDDATLPAHGWPWPWDNSNTTDYVYAFVDGECKTFTEERNGQI